MWISVNMTQHFNGPSLTSDGEARKDRIKNLKSK